MKGRVKWWSNERGYGFIEYDENNIFVHVESTDKTIIKENQDIEFIIEERESGKFLKLLTLQFYQHLLLPDVVHH